MTDFWDRLCIVLYGRIASHLQQTKLDAWHKGEGGKATFNPFNTTLKLPGDKGEYNSAGVRNYASVAQGVCGIAATLLNGLYRPILDALDDKHTLAEFAHAVTSSKWGTTYVPVNKEKT